jgi:cobalt-zinc-cadmium efflux system outer membrane protein
VRPPADRASEPALPSQELTLAQAVAHTFARSPEIRAAEARLGEARGRLTGAESYPYNPILEGGAASRQGGDQSSVDLEVSLGQELEIAGQRGDRIDTAEAELAAERATLLRARRLVAARVHLAFVAALEAHELLEVSRRDVELTRRLYELAQRRLGRGAGTQLDVNVAGAELGRAEARYQAAEATYRGERARLAEVMGLDPTFLPLPRGELRASLPGIPSLEQVVESARGRRADLQALRDLESASRARHELARSEAWPNLTLRAFASREEETDTIIGGGLSVPLPLFDRNQGRIEETRAGIDRAAAEREVGELAVDREVVAAHARYRAGLRTSARLRELVLGTLEQNIELLQRSFEAGKATWPEVVVIRRTLVDAERELTAAEAQARRAWIELQVAAGRMPVPEPIHRPEENR